MALESLAFGINNELHTKIGSMHNRITKFPKCQDVTISKAADGASNRFFKLACSREVIEKVEIHVCSQGDNNPYMKYTDDLIFCAKK